MASTPSTAKPKLYSNWMSSCSQRVRIALNLKGLDYEYKAVRLLPDGRIEPPELETLNPLKFVPVLVDGDVVVADSFAIILFLEDKYPEFRILPVADLQKKALNLQIASIICSGIQPHQNLSASGYIEKKLGSDERVKWTQHHINRGFTALEKLLESAAGKFATGDEVQLADVFLAPQIYAGKFRFQIDMSLYPTLDRLYEAYTEHPAFQDSMPERQPDAPSSS